MRYIITFLEGMISFLSPCMLPMLPLYLSYFAAGQSEKKQVLPRTLSFVLGFTLIFCLLGLFAGTLGAALSRYRRAVDLVCGILVILFGLAYLEVLPMKFLKGMRRARDAGTILSAFLFGMIYSVSLTPCVGAFLGSALMLAASAGGAGTGLLLLLAYSLGLGIPFLLSALLLNRLRSTFDFVKSHYRVINLVCGLFLILVGLLMALGWINRVLSLLT